MFNSKDKKGAAAPAPTPAAPVIVPAPVAVATPIATPAPAPVVVERSVPTNTISRGTSLQGNIETDANLRIEGRMKGDVKARSTFSVGEGAVVEGNISAEAAEIAGEIRGQVEVSTVLVLKSTAIVHGDILTDKFVVEAGAQFNGSCRMGQQASPLKLPALNAANGRRPEAVVSSN